MMLTFEDIIEAHKRIKGYILRTPLLRVPALDKKLGCKVYLKPENLQFTGSFKLRGATNRLLVLSDEQKKNGVVCASSGNHAQGVACAAQRLGIDAVIVMPTNCNPVKLNGAKQFGATVILEGVLSSEREAKADEFSEKELKTLIHPYDDIYVRAGQGTIGIEILEDEPELDFVVVPIGGGGLISGVSTAVKTINPQIKVIGVEPEGARRYGVSREAGKPIWLKSVNTIADGTRTDHANDMSFLIIENFVDELVSVDDESIILAMKESVSTAKLISEPSSVMVIAAAMNGKLSVKPDDKVCFVISGGNNDLSLLSEVIKS
jgi:threonine dehydratase